MFSIRYCTVLVTVSITQRGESGISVSSIRHIVTQHGEDITWYSSDSLVHLEASYCPYSYKVISAIIYSSKQTLEHVLYS